MNRLSSFEKPLAIYAHPDDEAIGCTNALQELYNKIHVAYVTDGAPSPTTDPEYYFPHTKYRPGNHYVSMRREEARKALAITGITDPNRIHFLGLEDSNLQRNIESLTKTLRDLMSKINPDLIITSALEGGHTDHDLIAALIWKLTDNQNLTICETPLYHQEGEIIRHNHPTSRHKNWKTIVTPAQPGKKEMFKAYQSQQRDLQHFDPNADEYYHLKHRSLRPLDE